ncbi:XRE family transcriptional regulator [Streptomyces jumonjinensis]|uniref:XRE family transcriptional regulator n=2 Tax=Streptomyces TaxID=1883 RepID=UPI00331F6BE3
MTQRESALPEPSTRPPQPDQIETPAEFTAALRALRTWSGLTYRQLESKAGAHADTLPASTMATTLGRVTLPRERFVDDFARACGLGEEEIHQWLLARRRIAGGEPAPTRDEGGGEAGDERDGPVGGASAPAHAPRWWCRALVMTGTAGIGAVGALGVASLVHGASSPADPPTMPVTGLRMLAVGSWAQIHPARTPELCVTEGSDRTGRYETAVAAQRPCTQARLPQVFLEPVGRDLVQIQWHHPKYGIGCLTALQKGPGRGLLEPRDDCADTDRAQQFRVEPFGTPAAAHFRLRAVSTGECLSLRDQDTVIGAEVVQGRCSGAADQDFLLELIPPPSADPLDATSTSPEPEKRGPAQPDAFRQAPLRLS